MRVKVSVPLLMTIGFGAGGIVASGFASEDVSSDTGVSSTVECLPVVHGGIERNSSKVKTRGLQHFQPDNRVSLLCN